MIENGRYWWYRTRTLIQASQANLLNNHLGKGQNNWNQMDCPLTNRLKLLILSWTPPKFKIEPEPEHDDFQAPVGPVGISLGVASFHRCSHPQASQSSHPRPSHPSQSLATLKLGGLADYWYRSHPTKPVKVGSWSMFIPLFTGILIGLQPSTKPPLKWIFTITRLLGTYL